MNNKIIYNILSQDLSERSGNKAKNLLSLIAIRGIKVPKTWVIPWDVYQKYEKFQALVSEELLTSLQTTLDSNKFYAVRSSSNIEDSCFHSFAGLFKTILHVQGYENLKNAVVEIWQSSHSEAVEIYLDKHSISVGKINMAVIIQEMIRPIYSGVLFNRNPMTGTGEIVIEGVPGEGTALVQDGVTPERWVSRGGLWVAKPEEHFLPEAVAKRVLEKSRKILKKIKQPIDLEWVYDGKDVYWVQMREITTLTNLNIYSNRFSKDMMPGMIHPLIWSINVPLVNTVWLGLLEEIVGKLPIEAEDLAKSFYYRSYFNMGTIGEVFTRVGLPSEGLDMMMGLIPNQEGRPVFKPTIKMVPLLPRLIWFIVDKWNFERKILTEFPTLENAIQNLTPYPEPDISLETQVKEINQLFNLVQKIVFFNVVTPILESMYTRLFEKQLNKFDVDLLQFDLFNDMRELDQYNPNVGLKRLHEMFDSNSQKEVLQYQSTNNENKIVGTVFDEHLNQFIKQFGHLSDNSNNFMAVPWRENPDAVLNMIQQFQPVDREKEERIEFEDLPIKGIKKALIKFLYHRVRNLTLYRERISKQYIFGYGLFRPYFFQLAEGLVAKDVLGEKEDIFFLTWEEIQQAIATNDTSTLKEKIQTRKEEIQNYEDIILPDVIYGDDPPPVFSEFHDRMFGTPTSQGYYSGPIKIVKGIEDFNNVLIGDVIVIPYSDVGWTPLFIRAGAVIAESGGLLSHSSIIAREYQIPAIVSVPNCMKLKDNQKVSVNGYTGEIVLLNDEVRK